MWPLGVHPDNEAIVEWASRAAASPFFTRPTQIFPLGACGLKKAHLPTLYSQVVTLAASKSDTRSSGFFQDATIDDLRLAAAFRRGFRQALIQINRSLAQHDLSPLQYHLLLEAGAAGSEGCVQGELAELIQAPEARVSLMVHELNARGLVRTLRSAPDRRMVRVGLTESGCRVVEAALHAQRAALHDMAREFDVPGVAQMLRGAVQLYLGVDIAEEGRL
jgi:DNA-binding MarR family transcriptional regulator